jgi:hypothetical protein
LLASATAIIGMAGCGAADHPPTLGDFVAEVDSGAGDYDAAPLDFTQPVPTCNLGPEGGVCACVDQPLVVDAPNIYFVLDRSGSMNDFNKWPTVRSVLGQVLVALGPRARFGVTVFPSPRADGCSPGVEVFAPHQGDAPAGKVGPTERALLTVLGGISASGGTPTAATFRSIAAHLQSLPGKTYVIFATDGGPNCNPNLNCAAGECQPNMEGATGCPAGGSPNCCASPATATGGPLQCEDTAATVAAVASLAASGIPVYVIGVPESEPYAGVLDQLAVAGGTARGADAGGGAQYYAVTGTDSAALEAALSAVAAEITGTCTFDLGSPPADPGLVNVFFDDQALAQTGPDGWTLSGTTVTVLGASCQQILSGSVLDVRVIAGCPTVQH